MSQELDSFAVRVGLIQIVWRSLQTRLLSTACSKAQGGAVVVDAVGLPRPCCARAWTLSGDARTRLDIVGHLD